MRAGTHHRSCQKRPADGALIEARSALGQLKPQDSGPYGLLQNRIRRLCSKYLLRESRWKVNELR